MARTITAVAEFQSFQDYYERQKEQLTPRVKGVVKAELAPLPASSHVVISQAARSRLAREQPARMTYDLEM